MDLFEPLKKVNEDQWHTKFKLLKEDPYGEGERVILQRKGVLPSSFGTLKWKSSISTSLSISGRSMFLYRFTSCPSTIRHTGTVFRGLL